MCIRDSMYDVLQGISDHAKLQIVLNAVEKGSNPVSYTHLDVYKRQVYAPSDAAWITVASVRFGGTMDLWRMESVS